jgi:2-oxoglutarate dehydrogenase E2 component (dihydrolipoamide succinyltransferase)
VAIELKVPSVGESVTEVQIGEWLLAEGDWADLDEPVVVIESDKATFEMPAPVAGVISKILKKGGEAARVGDVIGMLEPQPRGDQPKKAKAGARAAVVPAAASPAAAAPAAQPAAPPAGAPHVMPAAQRVLGQAGVSPQAAAGSGPGGRVTKADAQRAVDAARKAPAGAPKAPGGTRGQEIVPMTLMRRKIAERLVHAQQTGALLTTFNEVDMSAVQALRSAHKDAFLERHGVKLGFMSFFVRAVIDALGRFPELNAEIRGDDIVYHEYFDIGVAVGGGRGLVVPVLRNAERLGFADIEKTIADFGQRARDNKLSLEELTGGTFTISNGGVYGSLMSTPIVNPPQSGILGLHAIQDRPVVRGGQIVVKPMMYVALTYDHRIVDGREAVSFLVRVKEVIENPARLLLEV